MTDSNLLILNSYSSSDDSDDDPDLKRFGLGGGSSPDGAAGRFVPETAAAVGDSSVEKSAAFIVGKSVGFKSSSAISANTFFKRGRA